MDSFSWSDRIHALGLSSCLTCLSSSSSSNDHQQPSDTLQGLLADSASDGETLSLHSNLGERRRRKKRTSKGISLFGYNLFGRAPGVHLDGEDDALVAPRPRRRASSEAGTLDADAAPLDPAAIEARAAEEERRQKEERRRRRRERRALRDAARALASPEAGGDEFEGFPGSGASSYPAIPPPFHPSQTLPPPRIPGLDDDDDDEADADLGGELYVRSAPADGGSNGSDSRSRTSASVSSSGVGYSAPQMPRSPTYMEPAAQSMPTKKRSKKSRSSTTTSQSRSLASPPPVEQSLTGVPAVVSPTFEGFPGDDLASPPQEAFPSTGLGGRKANGQAGAFLARSGL